ncbi:MAG: hypothetical protein NT169_26820 [Chloroflexi bacterium]|nr:hypothetical protein [Chloroflexota bacterium]
MFNSPNIEQDASQRRKSPYWLHSAATLSLCAMLLGLLIWAGYGIPSPSAIITTPSPESPTRPPAVVPRPSEESPKGFVTVDRLRLFNAFGGSGDFVAELRSGDAVKLLSQSSDGLWILVEPVKGSSGWVRADRLMTTTEASLPLASPAASPAVLLADDFHDPKSGWSISTNASGSAEYDDGAIVIRILDCSYYWISCQQRSFMDVEIEVEAQLVTGDNPNFGLSFRWWDGYGYTFFIRPDGSYSLQKSIDRHPVATSITEAARPFPPIWTWWENLALGTSDAIRQKNQGNTIKVSVNGTHIGLYANDQSLLTITDRTYDGGQVCLMAFNYYASSGECRPAEVRFSNITIRSLVNDRPVGAEQSTPPITPPWPTDPPGAQTTRVRLEIPTPLIDPSPVPGSKCRFMHIVRPVDNWPLIEQRYGVSMENIQAASQLDTSKNPWCCLTPEPPQVLCIP